MSKLPSSVERKYAETDPIDEFIDQRWMYVHELRSILEQFEDTDYVELNAVKNLNVCKDDGTSLGTIEILWARFTTWDEEE